MSGLEGGKLTRTSKVLTVEEAEKVLADREGTFKLKQKEKKLEEVPGYEDKLQKYYKWIGLRADSADVINKPLNFYHVDTAESKAREINSFFGKEVSRVERSTIGNRDSYKVKLDVAAIKETFKDIINADNKLLESQKGIAA